MQRLLGPNVKLITPGNAIAKRVRNALAVRNIENSRYEEGNYRFLCTGKVETFCELGTRFLQMPLGEVQQVQLSPVQV